MDVRVCVYIQKEREENAHTPRRVGALRALCPQPRARPRRSRRCPRRVPAVPVPGAGAGARRAVSLPARQRGAKGWSPGSRLSPFPPRPASPQIPRVMWESSREGTPRRAEHGREPGAGPGAAPVPAGRWQQEPARHSPRREQPEVTNPRSGHSRAVCQWLRCDLLAALLIFTSVWAPALEQLPAGCPPCAAAPPARRTFPGREALESSGLALLLGKTHLAFLGLLAGNY